MFMGFTGWFYVVLIYVGIPVIIGVILYFVIRLAVLHALKAHTRWVDNGKP